MSSDILFYILLFLVALMYSSVGHGGASGYLALMAFFSFPSETMRSTALLLNIFVSFTAFVQYYLGGHFRWKLFLPFAIASVPAAFIGGLILMDAKWYKLILGILLLFSVARLVGFKARIDKTKKEQSLVLSLIIGFAIGLISGMIGIGGGIILSPVILLLHWASMKQTAAVSALFILVNSISGITGVFTQGFLFRPDMALMIATAFTGGLLGSYWGAMKVDNWQLKKLLAIVLVMASVKLLLP